MGGAYRCGWISFASAAFHGNRMLLPSQREAPRRRPPDRRGTSLCRRRRLEFRNCALSGLELPRQSQVHRFPHASPRDLQSYQRLDVAKKIGVRASVHFCEPGHFRQVRRRKEAARSFAFGRPLGENWPPERPLYANPIGRGLRASRGFDGDKSYQWDDEWDDDAPSDETTPSTGSIDPNFERANAIYDPNSDRQDPPLPTS